MKNLLIFLLLIAFVTSSCDSWLDLQPENEVVKEDFWKTQADVESVLWSAYKGVQDLHSGLIHMGEMRADELKTINSDVLLARYGLISASNYFADWAEWYKIIGFCNLIIAESQGVVEIDMNYNTEEHEANVAEAKAIRALAYFYVVRWWKDAPLITEPYDTDDQGFMKEKNTDEEILKFICEDLKKAAPKVKELYDEEWELYGRFTQVAAYTLLADICLYMEDYDNVLTYCDKVLSSGKKILEPSENWFELFMDDFSNESILEISFHKKYNQRNSLFELYGKNTSDYEFAHHYDVFNLYNENDIRGKLTYNDQTLQLEKYVTTLTADDQVLISQDNSDFNFKLYRLAEVYFMQAEAYIMKSQFDLAKKALGEITNRAGLGRTVDAGDTHDEMLRFLLEEKHREFCGEGKRWFDLLRVAKKENWKRKDVVIDMMLTYVRGVDVARIEVMLQNTYAYYFPIHKDELKLNKLLEQNPYYK
ncbi:RagB/SusD family nutrient uptake outer membrane protein [Saccharicrinis sp. GN24d3]|uniref:RagB/SusD family nutrient uptake outer membrane protein n=1 Tax=Saccharicrinis sp. GN24d3 TaxID=3458416 RepID=UPI004035F298